MKKRKFTESQIIDHNTFLGAICHSHFTFIPISGPNRNSNGKLYSTLF